MKDAHDINRNIAIGIGKLLNQSVHVYFDVEWDQNSQDFWLFEKLGEDWLMSLAERSTLNTAIGKLSTVACTMLKTLIQLARRGTLTSKWTGIYFKASNLVPGAESKVYDK